MATLIITTGLIKKSPTGRKKVALSSDLYVARYWADLHGKTEIRHGVGDGSGCILVARSTDLIENGYIPVRYSDDVYGPGECEWEQEWAVWSSIPAALFKFHFDHPYDGEPPTEWRTYMELPKI